MTVEKQIVSSASEIRKLILRVLKEDLMINQVSELDESHHKVLEVMHEQPSFVYQRERLLSYAISDLGKFLSDIDLRTSDSEYDISLKKKMRNYVSQLEKVIVKYS